MIIFLAKGRLFRGWPEEDEFLVRQTLVRPRPIGRQRRFNWRTNLWRRVAYLCAAHSGLGRFLLDESSVLCHTYSGSHCIRIGCLVNIMVLLLKDRRIQLALGCFVLFILVYNDNTSRQFSDEYQTLPKLHQPLPKANQLDTENKWVQPGKI